ncbi:Retrovirus-related Pol polyprotein from transposon TNT 1-94 [Senna tora]|uniref:Retrovirus-related Pol polyprotein from transposon TNT 1-94 n=1 Tax=Senna tora TaxID=362788 RepID=A0A834X094_9FABA|nr:Retrovirus-related Pol polyprotein from transposon TNT 1-94 [Senna tora]
MSPSRNLYDGRTLHIGKSVRFLNLMGDNYRLWKEKIIPQLGWMDVDYAIRKDEPPALTDTSNKSEIDLYERWE